MLRFAPSRWRTIRACAILNSGRGEGMQEHWRAVVGFQQLYEVSDAGRVRSQRHSSTRRRLIKNRPSPKRGGYLRVDLCKDGTAKSYSVHRLVAMAFVPNPLGKTQVNRKDGVKTNTTAPNLEW